MMNVLSSLIASSFAKSLTIPKLTQLKIQQAFSNDAMGGYNKLKNGVTDLKMSELQRIVIVFQ